ncbi:sialin-like isoform X2 [Panulirus ornatus]|uniref:sialin-like isoform X2 n=1 Tax=Panulirus ornatus TaxID=150431 RepID=UPI003A8AFA0C
MTTAKGRTCGVVPARVSLALLTSAGVVVLYMLRINLSVAIVAMVHTPSSSSSSSSSSSGASLASSAAHTTAFCTTPNQMNWSSEATAVADNGEDVSMTGTADDDVTHLGNVTQDDRLADKMILTGTQKGMVLGAFFYGYFVTNVPGGRMAEVYGTKRVFGAAILIGGILSFFTPLAARTHYVLLILLRALIGLAHGVVYPAMNVMVAKWIPPIERPRFMSFTYMSNTLGTIITMPMCGLIIAAVDWPAVFYISGAVSLVWVLLWMLLMHDTPAAHPRISQEEQSYILDAINKGTTLDKPSRTPWRSFFTSVPLWATNIAHIGSMFGFNLLLTQLPTYMSSILGFSITSNGLLSALPFLTQFLGGTASSVVGDWLLTHKYITVNTSRKVFAIISIMLPGVVLLAVGQAGCNITLAVALFPVGTALSGAICSGHLASHLDLSPNFAGTILGVSNTLAYMVSMCVPVIVGAMTPDETLEQWQSVFWMTAAIYMSTAMVFVIFGSTEIQPWNYKLEAEAERPTPEEEIKFVEDTDQKPRKGLSKDCRMEV